MLRLAHPEGLSVVSCDETDQHAAHAAIESIVPTNADPTRLTLADGRFPFLRMSSRGLSPDELISELTKYAYFQPAITASARVPVRPLRTGGAEADPRKRRGSCLTHIELLR